VPAHSVGTRAQSDKYLIYMEYFKLVHLFFTEINVRDPRSSGRTRSSQTGSPNAAATQRKIERYLFPIIWKCERSAEPKPYTAAGRRPAASVASSPIPTQPKAWLSQLSAGVV
jgi:hypothetical protein